MVSLPSVSSTIGGSSLYRKQYCPEVLNQFSQQSLISFLSTFLSSAAERIDLAILVYYSVSSLEELKEFRNQYSDDYISELMPDYSPFKIKYGVQSTPTCFVIDKSGTVVLKTVGFDAEQVKEQIDK